MINRLGRIPAVLNRRRPAIHLRALLLCLLFTGMAPALAETEPTEEYKLKAALIYKLARFVEWPSGALRDRFRVCVLGKDPFGSALEVLESRYLNGLPIEVRRSRDSTADIDDCSLVFIAAGETRTARNALSNLNKKAILTIGDSEDFAEQGGMMQMSLEKRKIRFTINLHATNSARLKVAAPLLELSTVIRANLRGGTE